jgi:putative membrane protein
MTGDAAVPVDIAPDWQRLHPGTLALEVLKLGPRAINFIPAVAALGITGNWNYIIPMLGLFLLLSLVAAAVRWWRFRYRMADDAFVIESGLFARRHSTLPFDRIQDVSIEQGVIARMIGLAKVGFDTGAATAKKGDNGNTLDSIALADAEALREAIRARRAGLAVAAAAGPAAATDAPAPADDALLFAMSPGRVVLAGLFNFSLAALAVLGAAAQQFDDVLPFDIYDVDAWMRGAATLGLDDWVLAHRWLAGVGAAVMLILAGFATGVIRSVLRDWNFRLLRTPTGFRRTRGLFTRTDVVVPRRRVSAAIVASGWIRRRFGWHDLRLQSLANDGDKERDHIVVPLGQLGEVDPVIAEMGMARPDSAATWARAHVSEALPAMLFALLPIIGAVLLAWLEGPWAWALLIAVPPIIFGALIGARRHRWALTEKMLYIERGFWTPRLILLPTTSIQSADIRIGPLARRFGMASIAFGVPGGSSFSAHEISGIDAGAAYALRDALISKRG